MTTVKFGNIDANGPKFGGYIAIGHNMNGDVGAWWADKEHMIDGHPMLVGYGLRFYKSQPTMLKAIARVAKRLNVQFNVRKMDHTYIVIGPEWKPTPRPRYPYGL